MLKIDKNTRKQQNIYNNLYQNDLKFKKGEITDEMLVLHSVNLFFIDKDGSIK